ncbi:MAG: PAS domain-containing protein, partial [Polyangiaceae bacterium]
MNATTLSVNAGRDETEKEVYRSRQLLDAVLKHAPGFIMGIDEHGKLVFTNRLLPHLTMNDVIGTDFLEFLPSHERSAVLALFLSVLATGVSST